LNQQILGSMYLIVLTYTPVISYIFVDLIKFSLFKSGEVTVLISKLKDIYVKESSSDIQNG